MNDVLEEFILRVTFADGFPADFGEADVFEEGGVDGWPKVALSLRDRSAEYGEDADRPLRAESDNKNERVFGGLGLRSMRR